MSDVVTVLDERSVSKQGVEQLKELRQEDGTRHILLNQNVVASEGIDEWARMGRIIDRIRRGKLDAMEALRQKADIAILGGGLGVIPRLFGPLHVLKVYEIEPTLSIYCPSFAQFIPGDWSETLSGLFDVIIFDTGEDAPPANGMQRFLKPGGIFVVG